MSFPEPYMTLFNSSSAAVKSVDSQIKVGGPATMQLNYIADFVAECENRSIAYDFVSSHMYPNDGMCPGSSEVNQHGEHHFPDCFPALVKAAKARLPPEKPLYLTEYSVGCCGEDANPSSAALIFRAVGALSETVEVLSYWTFSMIFEENPTPNAEPVAELTGTFALLSVHGVPKPGWAAFKLLHAHAGDRLLPTVSDPPWDGAGTVDTSTCKSTPIGCFNDIQRDPACCAKQPRDPKCQGCGNPACKMNSYAHFGAAPTYNTPELCMRRCAEAGWEVFGIKQAECKCGMAADWKHGASSSCVPNQAINCTEPCPGGAMGGSAMCGSQGNLRMFSLDCPGRQSAPRVVAFATANASSFDSSAGVGVAVFLSYWLDGPTQKVELRVNLQTHATKATLYRIDGDHANAAKLWGDQMHSVAVPDVQQLNQLRAAAEPVGEQLPVEMVTCTEDRVLGSVATVTIDAMPSNAAYVVTIQ